MNTRLEFYKAPYRIWTDDLRLTMALLYHWVKGAFFLFILFNSGIIHYVDKIYICTYIINISIYALSTCSRYIVSSGSLLNNKMDLPRKSRRKCNELFQDLLELLFFFYWIDPTRTKFTWLIHVHTSSNST